MLFLCTHELCNYIILDVRKIGHLNIKTKMLDIETCVLVGWHSLASQSERVLTRCFYVKVAYLSYGEYSYQVEMVRALSCGVLVTRFLHKQWHVTSHVFEVT